MTTEQQVIAELNHLGKRRATWMGRTLNPEAARECVRRGWARIDGDGYYLLTEAGREENSQVVAGPWVRLRTAR